GAGARRRPAPDRRRPRALRRWAGARLVTEPDMTRPDIDLVSGEFWGANPHDALTWMRHHEPVYWDGRVWGITMYDDLKEVSKHPDLFSNAGGIRPESGPVPMMIDMDDPAHLKRRKLVNK